MSRIRQCLQRARDWVLDHHFETVMNLYPPYVGAGIEVVEISDDFRYIEVEMPLTWYNRNYVGTQFGGSLYSMCDPFYMLMFIRNLGDEYIVWDKAADIRFRNPGTGTVRATFEIDESDLEAVRRAIDEEGVVEPEFDVEVVDTSGDVVAEVTKTLYVRRKE
jgi:acyl-coenzyme A thioesterase PaaI-like protein